MIERATFVAEMPSLDHNGRGPQDLPAIQVRQLVKNFDEIQAVRGVDFDVAAGEVFGFLGPNGAGKTTTINMLCTLAKPTAGEARVAGHDVVTERDDVRRNIGLVFQDPTLDNYLTGRQNLELHAELYGLQRSSSPRGCSRCWRWSGCGSAGTPWSGPTPAGCAGAWRSPAG